MEKKHERYDRLIERCKALPPTLKDRIDSVQNAIAQAFEKLVDGGGK